MQHRRLLPYLSYWMLGSELIVAVERLVFAEPAKVREATDALRDERNVMALLRWNETNRERLDEVLPEALVVLPIGATEQHGPHLPTGTDAFVAEAVAYAAASRAADRARRDLVVAPVLSFGASDHHLPFGATLSLSPETMTAALVDLARSVAADGGGRMVIVNGHGGNKGPCNSAGAVASTRHGVALAYVDYWDLFPADAAGASVRPNVPGHAGAFETSLVLGLRPELVAERPARETQPAVPEASGVTVHANAVWGNIDGYTDRPADADADAGKRWFDALADALADRLVTLADVL